MALRVRLIRSLRKVARASAGRWYFLETILLHPHARSFEAPAVQVTPSSPTSLQEKARSVTSSTSTLPPRRLRLLNPDATSLSTGSSSSLSSRYHSIEEVLDAGDSSKVQASHKGKDVAAAEKEHTDTIDFQPEAPQHADSRHSLYPDDGAYPANPGRRGSGDRFPRFGPLTNSLKHKHKTRDLNDKLGNSIQSRPSAQDAEQRQLQPRGDQHKANGKDTPHPDPLRSLPPGDFAVGSNLTNVSSTSPCPRHLDTSIRNAPNGEKPVHRQSNFQSDQCQVTRNDIHHPNPFSLSPPHAIAVDPRHTNLPTAPAPHQHQFNHSVIPAPLFDGRPSKVSSRDPSVLKAIPSLPSPHPAFLRPGHGAVATPPHQLPALRHTNGYQRLRREADLLLQHAERLRLEKVQRDREEVEQFHARLSGALEDLGEFDFDAWKF